MGLPSLALRWATVFALRGRTWAGDRVLDEPGDPEGEALKSDKPLISVFSSNEVNKVTGRDLLAGDRKSGLVIQIYLPVVVRAPETAGTDIDIDASRAAATATSLIEREIETVLLAGTHDWAKLWRDIVYDVDTVESRPYLIEQATGARLAAREIEFTFDTLASPFIGVSVADLDADSVWARLLARMQAEPRLQPLRPLVAAAIEGASGMPSWRVAQASLGLTEAGIRGIGLAPVDATETGEAAIARKITIEDLAASDVVIEDEPTP